MPEYTPDPNGQAEESVQYVQNTLGAIILSTVVISGINIIVSGHLLGYTFGLLKEDLDDHKNSWFRIWFPWVLHLGISGHCVYAGFASVAVFILFVGTCMSSTACTVFITNLGATDNKWVACQSLAASLSVLSCLIFASFRRIYDFCKAIKQTGNSALALEERATRLVSEPSNPE